MELYPEFTPVYIGMAAVLVLLAVVLILLILVLVKVGKLSKGGRGVKAVYGGNAGLQSSGNVVFCKSCATEFEASEKCCPKCGTPR